MFNLPERCIVNKFIPKKVFYEKVALTSNIKDEFINLVQRITWLYKLSPDTLKINKTDRVEEIQIFQIDVKEKTIPKRAISVITKTIPYPILFVIKYNEEYCYSIKVHEEYYSEWNEELDFIFTGISLEHIYEHIVKKIIKEEHNQKNFEKLIQDNTKIEILKKKIEQQKRKVIEEKQFNRKVELNKELHELKKEMECLLNE